MLDPARMRKMLLEFRISAAAYLCGFIEHDDGRPGGALVDRQHVPAHRPTCCFQPVGLAVAPGDGLADEPLSSSKLIESAGGAIVTGLS